MPGLAGQTDALQHGSRMGGVTVAAAPRSFP